MELKQNWFDFNAGVPKPQPVSNWGPASSQKVAHEALIFDITPDCFCSFQIWFLKVKNNITQFL